MTTNPKMRDATRIQAEGFRYVIADVCGEAFVRVVGYHSNWCDAIEAAMVLSFGTGRPAAIADRLKYDSENPKWLRYDRPECSGRWWRPGPLQIDWTEAP